ncbi:MAG: CvpA family protein [Dysosmobacter sp.]|uniref:CvpA family protein n=1 Tax=Dysosmobacter sp. TaxID=2591382 RepID=UPI002848213B|nr:CvpA family protein [Dysosmobacter sp.]MDR3982281.1 CvpA family protein [Dysosmobacter sp.]
MTTPVIMDMIVAAVLVTFTIFGARRGLFRALAGLVAMIVALVGAGIIANTLAAPAAKLVTPLIQTHIEEKVGEAVTEQSGQAPQVDGVPTDPMAEIEGDALSIEDLLNLLGLDQDVRDSLAQQAQEKVQDTGVSIAMAVVESVAQSMIYGILYIVSFTLLLWGLKILIRATDLVLKLPGLHLANSLGGGAIGLIEAGLLVFLVIWVARRLGVSFETDAVAATHLLRFFTTNTPLSALSFLQ